MTPPVVAIPAHSERVRYGAWDDAADFVGATLVRAAQAAGARVLVIPLDDEVLADPRQMLDLVDGVVTESGGDDRNGPGSFPDAFAARAEAAGTPVLRIAPEAHDGDGAAPAAEEIARFIAALRR
jgi:gamma-glutamyl-gamma-aminobutyrate hydrolase PuuD